MNIESLTEKYSKVSEEFFQAQAIYDGHMAWNHFGRSLEETVDFYKSLSKATLNLEIKKSERDALLEYIKKISAQEIMKNAEEK